MKQPNVKKLVKSPESFCCCWQEKKQFLFFDKGPSNITKNSLWRGNIALKWWEHRNTRKQQTNTSLTHLTQTHALRAIKPGGQMYFLTMQTIKRRQTNSENKEIIKIHYWQHSATAWPALRLESAISWALLRGRGAEEEHVGLFRELDWAQLLSKLAEH